MLNVGYGCKEWNNNLNTSKTIGHIAKFSIIVWIVATEADDNKPSIDHQLVDTNKQIGMINEQA